MEPQHERVTMRTIADQLGVSKTTVSLALRGHHCISGKTRERVAALAHKMNYRPDPAIAAIAAQRWSGGSPERHRTIAFLCHHQPYWKALQFTYFGEAKQRAEELGYKLEPFFVDDYPTGRAISRVLYTRGIRGLIIPPILNPESKRVMCLEWDKFTAVCCGIGRVKPPLHTVTNDYFVPTRAVWNAVATAGFKRIGAALCCHDPIAEDDWQRIGASHAAIHLFRLEESAKIPFLTTHVLNEPPLLEWFHRYKPEVIIGFNRHTGEILERHGVRIPQDVEFVCLTAPSGGKWSGIVHHHNQVSRSSIDVLTSELRDNRWGLPELPNLIFVHPEWNQGETFSGGDIGAQIPFQVLHSHAPAASVPSSVGAGR